MVTMQGNVSDNGWVPCSGAPPITTNHIDATRYFVKQHYIDFLGRDPSLPTADPADVTGWNFWQSQITTCVFDLNCIYSDKLEVGHRFLLASTSVAQDPDMANPPGSPGFNPVVYNRAYIKHCYRNYLQREPDPGGWDYWMNVLETTGNYLNVIHGFQWSTEYRNRFCPTCF